MFSKIFFLFTLSTFALGLCAQTQLTCGYKPTTQEKTYYKSVVDLLRNSVTTRSVSSLQINGSIPIYFWVNQTNSSIQNSPSALKTLVNQLNTSFQFLNSAPFTFCGVSYINDGNYQTLSVYNRALSQTMYNTYSKANAINVYIPTTTDYNFAFLPSINPLYPNPPIIVLGTGQRSDAFTHEMGHHLGLFHTFNDYPYDPNQLSNNGGNERVTRDGTGVQNAPNFAITADFMQGTAADILLCGTSGLDCNLTPCTSKDDNNQVYTPSFTNFMSYYPCRSKFEFEQQVRMYTALTTTTERSNEVNGLCANTFSNFGRIGRQLGGSIECQTGNDNTFYLQGAFVNLQGMNGTYTTDANGYYVSQNGLSLNSNYTIIPTKNDDYQAGVTTYDIALMSKHILGIQSFTSSYQMISADIDNSGDIDGYDMLLVRRLILGIIPNLPVGSWRFIPKYFMSQASFAYQFNALNPFGATITGYNYLGDQGNSSFMDKIDYNSSVPDNLKLGSWDFLPIKSGDVNGSYFTNCATFGGGGGAAAAAISLTDGGTLSTRVANNTSTLSTAKTMTMKNAEAKTIVLKAKSAANIVSMQVGFRFLNNKMAISDVVQGDFNSSNDVFDFSNFAKGEMRALWFDKRGNVKNIKAGAIILKAKIKANADVNDILKVLNLDDQILKNEFHDAKGNLVPIDLEWTDDDASTIVENPISATVYPNPFTNNLTFDVNSKVAGAGTLTITNVITKQSLIVQHQFNIGNNTLTLNNTNALNTGSLTFNIVIGTNIFNGIITKVK